MRVFVAVEEKLKTNGRKHRMDSPVRRLEFHGLGDGGSNGGAYLEVVIS